VVCSVSNVLVRVSTHPSEVWGMSSFSWAAVISLGLCLMFVGPARGHGRIRAPPGRSTMWRYNYDTAENVNDHETNCGGFGKQWNHNDGLCGICGDAYDLAKPRPNEMGGIYGQGIITETYTENQVIDIEIELTAYHQGFFEFRLCPLNTRSRPASQTCLDKHIMKQETGAHKYYPAPPQTGGRYWVRYQLPRKVTCELCVLQWRYYAGNSWGRCGNSTEGIGCGPQEEFRACSDIAIHSKTGWFDTTPSIEVDTDGRMSSYEESSSSTVSDTAVATTCTATVLSIVIACVVVWTYSATLDVIV